MDLYVNFQGLKYNFEKVWGCFGKITRWQQIFRINELFFY
jgi:hypothetical protein